MHINIASTIKFILLSCLVAVAVAGGYFLVTGSGSVLSRPETDIDKMPGLKSMIREFQLTEKLGDDEKWELSANEVAVNKLNTELTNVRLVYHTDKNGPINLSSDNAVMPADGKDASFSGNVSVTTPKPLLLETEVLKWDSKKRNFFTDKRVKITTNRAVINGVGMILVVDKKQLTVLDSVEAVFD